MGFSWGVGSDPEGEASVPVFTDVSALELYDHEGDTGDLKDGETYEWCDFTPKQMDFTL